MIRVVVGALETRTEEAVLRPIRADLTPVSNASRDIGRVAGGDIEARLEAGGHLPVGGAVVTPGGGLPCAFVIHVVTCAVDEPQSWPAVQKALRNGLRRAADFGIESLALPPLGIGVGTMEAENEARALVDVLADHIAEGVAPLELTLVAANAYEGSVFEGLVAAVAGPDPGGAADG